MFFFHTPQRWKSDLQFRELKSTQPSALSVAVEWNPIEFSQFLYNFIDLRTVGTVLAIFRVSPLSLEEKVRWALLWRIIVASRCFNFYVKILISGFSRSKTVRSILFLGLKMEILGGGGSWQPQKKAFQNRENREQSKYRRWSGGIHRGRLDNVMEI